MVAVFSWLGVVMVGRKRTDTSHVPPTTTGAAEHVFVTTNWLASGPIARTEDTMSSVEASLPKPVLVTCTELAADVAPTSVAGRSMVVESVDTIGPANGALQEADHGPGAIPSATSKMVLPVPPPSQTIRLSLASASSMSTALSSVHTAVQLPASSAVNETPVVPKVSRAVAVRSLWPACSPPV
ncbi:unannotated protein [freshwater metagenome]|uniref:Unannotated protein n=1 Tax=freshwater metagenome TaxID=449393 RepID=A0A6J6Q136_9ZZZZ